MKYKSVFDIIGPIMVGPSSSHTAGAVRIGQIARSVFGGTAAEAEIKFYGSFAHTYRGHGTDVAVIAGLLGLSTFDERIPDAFKLAEDAGMKINITTGDELTAHPNTAGIVLKNADGSHQASLTGVSVGGGSVEIIEINGFRVQMSGDAKNIIIMHRDVFGSIAAIAGIFAKNRLNISRMEVSRHERGDIAMMLAETDEQIPDSVISELKEVPQVSDIIWVKA